VEGTKKVNLMLRLEIPDDILARAVTDAVSKQLQSVNELTGYVDMNGACQFLSVGKTQFKEWVKAGQIHPRKVSSHLVRYKLSELQDFIDQFRMRSH
jgi:predicted DNA-binding transcriptional regulator AlpA